MKLLVDMNLSPCWVESLAKFDIPAVHWSTVGRADAPDSDIIDYAVQHGYVVFTHDLDFSAILAATQADKPSVVQIRSDNIKHEAFAPVVAEALARSRNELMEGALVTIDPKRMRLRILPLRGG